MSFDINVIMFSLFAGTLNELEEKSCSKDNMARAQPLRKQTKLDLL